MKKLIVASGNADKIKEISQILKGKYEVVSMKSMNYNLDIEETGTTFYENALIKAKTLSNALNEDALGEDSGLCVKALNNAPGIYSARYSGEDKNDERNIDLLLKNLDGAKDREAKFCSCIVLYKKSGEIISGYGETYGAILCERHGSNGFGYDSVFYSKDLGKSFGLASDSEKNSISHRSKAIKDLLSKL